MVETAEEAADALDREDSDFACFRSLNAGLRLENSDLKGHVNILEGKLKAAEEPKPSAGASTLPQRLRAMGTEHCTVTLKDAEKIYNLRKACREAADALAAKDAATAAVIADNDAQMATIERLKHSLGLYRADIHTMREQAHTMAAERSALREQIDNLKADLSNWQKIAQDRTEEILRLRNHDLAAAAKRARDAYILAEGPDYFLDVARAVYGLKSEAG